MPPQKRAHQLSEDQPVERLRWSIELAADARKVNVGLKDLPDVAQQHKVAA